MNHQSDRLGTIVIDGEAYYKIADSGKLRPFFMSITSAYDHWLFISSNGGLTAGRKNSEYALFPYYTDDKVTESVDLTGSKTIIKIKGSSEDLYWEPYSTNAYKQYKITQNLYKNSLGNKVIFEEVNEDLGLTFSYQWSSSDEHGLIRRSTILNQGDNDIDIEFIDGLLNIVPAGIGSGLQNNSSNLGDAYKRSILDARSGLGVYALSAVIVDRAEPSEALKANVIWSTGLSNPTHLLSAQQLDKFRRGDAISGELDVKGEKGAYLLHSNITLSANQSANWCIVADVNKNHTAVFDLIHKLTSDTDHLMSEIVGAIAQGDQDLLRFVASADGLQKSSDDLKDGRHFANVMFNIMRGGIFDQDYQIERLDFLTYLRKANVSLYETHLNVLDHLGAEFSVYDLQDKIATIDVPAFTRLAIEYLPLKFSRRHGDPSRPWNKFSINLKNELDESKILDYQGNWRDIFQNWEALSLSYPAFINGMVYRFLNASTFDGYNPYRVTKDGFDWETIEPDDPWSYIGYWGDHQIIYLLKLLECLQRYQPDELNKLMTEDVFAYAAVPYRIKSYEDILADPKSTVDFDRHWDEAIRERRDRMGSDGALLATPDKKIYHVNFIEKILATALSKVSNLVPEGGIWMNTQRPEWNDANNALVGNGISMVTLYYLYRFVNFFEGVFDSYPTEQVEISAELLGFFNDCFQALDTHKDQLTGGFNDQQRKAFMDAVGTAGSTYRLSIYDQGFSGNKQALSIAEIRSFWALCKDYFAQSIRANRRDNGLYHAYNILNIDSDGHRVSYLNEMLEGQVSVLSAGLLSPTEVIELLKSLRASKLYRPDQNSYILYPNKELANFLQKNHIPHHMLKESKLLLQLLGDGDVRIIEKDVYDQFHFNGDFRNNIELSAALDSLQTGPYAELVKSDRQIILDIYEHLFNHREFTGRSGTFYAYEGLGSIYWHMVSKLILAIQECYHDAQESGAEQSQLDTLAEQYYEAWNGLGIHKSPGVYGAFSTDPYSHTPYHRGAQQPGMTGQVKEDIISRFGELGVRIKDGSITFNPSLLRADEFLTSSQEYLTIGLDGKKHHIVLEPGSLGFTLCQVPIIYHVGNETKIVITNSSGQTSEQADNGLSIASSQALLSRSGSIARIDVTLTQKQLL